MTVLTATSASYHATAASSIDRAIRLSTAAAVLAVAGLAAYVSYWHAYSVVRAYGESGITARLEPATIDGLVYASSMLSDGQRWPVDRASDEEIVALLRACCSARDRLIVLLMARAGRRRGEVCGLRRSDVHLLPDSAALGCEVPRAHLHMVRRENPNGAWAKSRRQRAVPLDFLVVQAFDGL